MTFGLLLTQTSLQVYNLIYKQNMYNCKITNEECYKDEIMLASDAHTHRLTHTD